jgi:hypothetical protein
VTKLRIACCAGAAFVFAALAAGAAFAQGARSGAGPCRVGAQALIGLLDEGADATPDYRHAFEGVVRSCGPAARSVAAPDPRGRAACRDMALRLLDLIEDRGLNTLDFARTRDAFAATCAPR